MIGGNFKIMFRDRATKEMHSQSAPNLNLSKTLPPLSLQTIYALKYYAWHIVFFIINDIVLSSGTVFWKPAARPYSSNNLYYNI